MTDLRNIIEGLETDAEIREGAKYLARKFASTVLKDFGGVPSTFARILRGQLIDPDTIKGVTINPVAVLGEEYLDKISHLLLFSYDQIESPNKSAFGIGGLIPDHEYIAFIGVKNDILKDSAKLFSTVLHEFTHIRHYLDAAPARLSSDVSSRKNHGYVETYFTSELESRAHAVEYANLVRDHKDRVLEYTDMVLDQSGRKKTRGNIVAAVIEAIMITVVDVFPDDGRMSPTVLKTLEYDGPDRKHAARAKRAKKIFYNTIRRHIIDSGIIDEYLEKQNVNV